MNDKEQEDKEKENIMYLIDEKPWRAITKFSIPLFLGTLIQQIYSISDAVIAGRFIGKDALAAVGVNAPLIQIAISLFFGISIGANILISQNFGAKNKQIISKIIDTFMISLYIASFIFIGLVLIFARPIHEYILHTPPDVIEGSLIYIRTLMFGALSLFAYNGLAAILRAVGDSRRPLIILIVSNIINIIFSILFVTVLKFGIAGIALATAVSQTISFIIGIIYINTRSKIIRLHFFKSEFDIKMLKNVISVGLPVGIQGTFVSVGMFVFQYFINSFGSIVVAGYSIAIRIEFIISSLASDTAQHCYVDQTAGSCSYLLCQCFKSVTHAHTHIHTSHGIVCCVCKYFLLLTQLMLRRFKSFHILHKLSMDTRCGSRARHCIGFSKGAHA